MNRVLCLLLLFIVCSAPSRADLINLTGAETAPNIAEIEVLDDRVRVAIEIFIQDLKTFEEIITGITKGNAA